MSFTRFHDDPARIIKQNQISTFSERYYLNTPGQGINLPFEEDPHIRLQSWGANLTTNNLNLESDLRGLSRKYTKDLPQTNQYTDHKAQTQPYQYRSTQPFVEESRASHPAWLYKDLEQTRWEYPIINPQANLEKQFHSNVQTRILEKDRFVPGVYHQTNYSY